MLQYKYNAMIFYEINPAVSIKISYMNTPSLTNPTLQNLSYRNKCTST